MTGAQFDRQRARLEVEGWSVRVRLLDRYGHADPEAAWLSIHVRRGLELVVEFREDASELLVETWAGEPDGSDGRAVVTDSEGDPVGIARIPLCECGDRGCGNAGTQLYGHVPVTVLPALVDLLRALPEIFVRPERGRTWLGDLGDLPEQTRRSLTAP